nr:MAG TPA: hypothetical protein [Caudoviricetes sp.]
MAFLRSSFKYFLLLRNCSVKNNYLQGFLYILLYVVVCLKV